MMLSILWGDRFQFHDRLTSKKVRGGGKISSHIAAYLRENTCIHSLDASRFTNI